METIKAKNLKDNQVFWRNGIRLIACWVHVDGDYVIIGMNGSRPHYIDPLQLVDVKG